MICDYIRFRKRNIFKLKKYLFMKIFPCTCALTFKTKNFIILYLYLFINKVIVMIYFLYS